VWPWWTLRWEKWRMPEDENSDLFEKIHGFSQRGRPHGNWKLWKWYLKWW
jgi:hypothetical protein